MMTREQKINRLLQLGPDDIRRLALDGIDATARESHTWGTAEHRQAREKTERSYDQERTSLEKLSDDQLDKALAAAAPTSA